MSEYVFVANCADEEDIQFENGKFRVNTNVDAKENYYLEMLVSFLNGHSGQTELFFDDHGNCVDNKGKQGHYHVRFCSSDGNKSLQKFLQNYNCDQVYNPIGMENYLSTLQYIGMKS